METGEDGMVRVAAPGCCMLAHGENRPQMVRRGFRHRPDIQDVGLVLCLNRKL